VNLTLISLGDDIIGPTGRFSLPVDDLIKDRFAIKWTSFASRKRNRYHRGLGGSKGARKCAVDLQFRSRNSEIILVTVLLPTIDSFQVFQVPAQVK
jgi:hypothetical protein